MTSDSCGLGLPFLRPVHGPEFGHAVLQWFSNVASAASELKTQIGNRERKILASQSQEKK